MCRDVTIDYVHVQRAACDSWILGLSVEIVTTSEDFPIQLGDKVQNEEA
ncbi:MAG: hypothetical protein NC543_03350 [bacterium]|nr:hypothetical protein [bacterium]MCM1373907.1 hypothetical protein [Muribaculum sp.]